MLTVNFLATNNYKTKYSDLSKDTTIDSLKIKFYREHSSNLPLPSSVFIENDEESNDVNNNNNNNGDKDVKFKEINESEEKVFEEKTNYYSRAHSSIIHSHQIRFLFSGKQLENFSTLEENKIENDSTIIVAVSPFLVNIEEQFLQHQKKQNQKESSNQDQSDTVFVGVSRRDLSYMGGTVEEKINYKLSINDRSFKSSSLQSNSEELHKLDDLTTYNLLSRINDFNDTTITKDQTASPVIPNVNLIPSNKSFNSDSNVEQDSRLETCLDRLSLYDIPSRDKMSSLDSLSSNITTSTTTTTTTTITDNKEIVKQKLSIEFYSPNGEVSFADSISIMFNRPFLDLSTTIKDIELPIKVDPPVKGASWQSVDGVLFRYRLPTSEPKPSDGFDSGFSNLQPNYFPLSTTFKVSVECSNFKKLFKEDIAPLQYSFTTSPQSLLNWEFNNNLITPQIKLSFSQPIDWSKSSTSIANLFSIKTNSKLDPKFTNLSFVPLDPNDESCHWKKQLEQTSANVRDRVFCISITSKNIIKYESTIEIDVKIGSIASKEGPNFNPIKSMIGKIVTPPLLSITAELLPESILSKASEVSFISNNYLQIQTIPSSEYENYLSIQPKVEITSVLTSGKKIRILGKFKHSQTYSVSIKNFKDAYGQVGNSRGIFSFPSIPFKIWTCPSIDSFTNNLYYNLDPNSHPIFKVNSTGADQLIIKAYSVSKKTLKRKTKLGGSLKVDVNKIKNENGEYESISTTIIDLSSFFGGRNVHSCKFQLLLFTISDSENLVSQIFSKEKETPSFLLQYTAINVNSFEVGKQIIINTTDSTSREFLKNLTLKVYNSNSNEISTIFKKDKKLYKEYTIKDSIQLFEKSTIGSHMFISTLDGKNKCLYKVSINEINKKPYEFHAMMFAQQGINRPGHTVNVKGTIRVVVDEGVILPNSAFFSKYIDVYQNDDIYDVSYTLTDAKKKEIGKGKTRLNEFGCFDLKLVLPLDINLGNCSLVYKYFNEEFSFSGINVQEFKLKTFLLECSMSTQSNSGIFELETPFGIELFAKSYTGEILPNTTVDWKISVTPLNPTISNLDKSFNYFKREADSMYYNESFTYKSKRSPNGKHNLDLVIQECSQCCDVRVHAIVSDLSNNQEEISKSFTVENTKFTHFGVSSGSIITHLINVGQDFHVDMSLCYYDNQQSFDGKIDVDIDKIPYEEDLLPSKVYTSTILPQADTPLRFSYQFKETGYYKIKLNYCNGEQLSQYHTISLFVFGKQTQAELEYKECTAPIKQANKISTIQKGTFTVKPKLDINCSLDKEMYQLGDSIKMCISSKSLNAKGYICCAKENTIINVIPIQLVDGQHDCKFEINQTVYYQPLFYVYLEGNLLVDINGQKVNRLTSSFVKVPVKIDYSEKLLTVEVEKCKKFQSPSEESTITINVKDKHEKPVSNANVSLIIVDQAVLDITKHSIKSQWDPFNTFFENSPFYIGRDRMNSLLDKTIYNDPEEIKTVELDVEDFQGENELQIINIKYMAGRIIQLKVSGETTIGELQQMIMDRDGLPASSQRLFYLNKQIDSVTIMKLKEFSIVNKATLNLVIRLHGGANTPSTDDKPDPTQDLNKPIRVRSNFMPLAYFGSLNTNQDGKVTFSYKLPDNLSTFRVMALVHHGNDQFGSCEHTFISSLPIMVRPSPPRFLNHKDKAIFPIMISSIVDCDLLFSGAIRSNNCNIETKGFSGILPAKSRIIFPVHVDALVSNCIADFQFIAKTQLLDRSQEICDAVSFKFPVYSSSVLESTTINHSLVNLKSKKEISSHNLKLDNWKDLDQQLGGLTITLSKTKLQKISCSVKDLLHYEYSCSEQIASKLLALSTFIKYPHLLEEKDIKALGLENIKTNKKPLEDMVAILKKRYQSSDHSFTYFDDKKSGNFEFVSVFVYFVLNQISDLSDEAKKLAVNAAAYFSGSANVMVFKRDSFEKNKFQYLLSKAFASFVYGTIKQTSVPHTSFISKILETSKLEFPNNQYQEIFIYLSQFYKSHIDFKNIANYVTITGSMAYVNSTPIFGFYGDTRAQSILILSLLETSKTSHRDHPLLERLISGLTHFTNKEGRYGTTQANAFNIFAISQYEKMRLSNGEKVDPTLDASIVLGNHYLEKKKVTIGDSENYTITIPFSQILKNQKPLIIQRKTKGTLYYSLNLSYGSLNPISKAISNRGINIKRTYYPVSNPNDVIYHQPPTANQVDKTQTIEIKAGSRVKVTLSIKVDHVSSFIVIKDRLPSGLEPLLSNSQYYNGYYFNHVNNRENGVEIYSNLLYPGVYNYSYQTIAITRGTFISPSAKIEEMYCPATFGRSSSEIVLIK
ncbi:hypothetical protein ACTFIV_000723 [Dictyostelium citrinum]